MSVNNVLAPSEAAVVIRALRPGQSFVYFTGDLALARQEIDGHGRLTPAAKRVGALATFMLRQGVAGEFSFGDGVSVVGHGNGTLVRRRLGVHAYEYLFVKGGTKT